MKLEKINMQKYEEMIYLNDLYIEIKIKFDN